MKLIGQGYAGPPIDLDDQGLSKEQVLEIF